MFWFGDSDRTALWVCAREAIIAVEYNFNVELLPIVFYPAKALKFQAIVCTIVVIIMILYLIFLILISLLYIQH